MSERIKRIIAILLVVCFVLSITAAAVDAQSPYSPRNRHSRAAWPATQPVTQPATTTHTNNRPLKVGDVTVNPITVTFHKNGVWELKATAISAASWVGDDVRVSFIIGNNLNGGSVRDYVAPGEVDHMSAGGTDPWISNHWSEVVNSPVTFRVHGQGAEVNWAKDLINSQLSGSK